MRNPQRRSTTPSGRKCIGQSLTQGFTFGQEFVTEIGDPDFTAAVTALSAGEYGLAAYDELVAFNTTAIVPLEEIIMGAAASLPLPQ